MDLENLLSPRITKHSLPLYRDRHYKHAAHEAMIQVELALKEKGRVNDNRYGHTLIKSLFHIGGKEQYIKLRVPLGQDLQSQAKQLFEGAFAYYRNYAAHDGSKIDQTQSLRIMILASELLDLIDASSLTFEDIGGIEGLLKTGTFDDKKQVLELLKLLDGYHMTDSTFDGLFEEMWGKIGANEVQLHALMDLDLVCYEEMDYALTLDELKAPIPTFPDSVGWFSLTELGKIFVQTIESKL